MTKRVYDPRGSVAAEERRPAARLARLDGMRLGILDNSKWNANKLLRELRDDLQARYGVTAVNYYRKESFSRFADPALLREIASANDAAVTAIGD
jgi:hypothetical protein